MHAEMPLLATIAMSLLFAFFGGWVASLARLSPIVGYLVAGIAVGPFTPGYVANGALAQELAEIGVILLMFGVGLHFSVKDLWSVRWIAVPGAVAQIAVATAIGVALSHFWGWSMAAGLVFGLALSVASTVVLLRALEERGWVETLNGRIAVGWLVVEDLAMVIALVLLPALAQASKGGDSGSWQTFLPALGLTLAKVALFIALVLVVGRKLVPWVLEQIARMGSREMFTLAVLALALGIAYASATLFGVSLALGAFFAGVVMSESDLSHQATADSLPLKDAFAVLFFVSVGMLFDPSILIRDPLAVIAVLLVIVVGKSLAAFAIVLLFRYPLGTALIVSVSLAQIGEFSFILAALGVAEGLLPPEAQTYILAGALLSIALNPMVFMALGPVERWVGRHPRLRTVLEWSSKDKLCELSEAPKATLSDHAIIIGHGRVGAMVAHGFEAEKIPYVVVEQNRQTVQSLRKKGVTALCGDASVAGVLESVGLSTARLLVVAIPDGFQVRQVVDIARTGNPHIHMVVRTHSDTERDYLERQGVGLAVMGERELALTMMNYALRGAGVYEEAANMVVNGLRTMGPASADDDTTQPIKAV